MKKDYINKYGKAPVRKFQEGGMAPAPEQMGPEGGAPAGGGGGQEAEVQAALEQVVQTQDPELALQVCNALAEMMGLGAGAGPEGAGAPPEGAPQGAPMARRGLKTRRVFSASLKG